MEPKGTAKDRRPGTIVAMGVLSQAKPRWPLCCFLALAISAALPGQAGELPIVAQGAQLEVNSYTPGRQNRSSVAVSPDGTFLALWTSETSVGDDTSRGSIQGRRFAADGSPIAGQFQVNSLTEGSQNAPHVGVDASGRFVVVWTSDEPRGQRLAADGSFLGAEFGIATYTSGTQIRTDVAVDPDGSFLVVWQNDGPGAGPDARGIQGQRFASDGSQVGSQFQVNSYSTGNQVIPAVARSSSGEFLVVWSSYQGSPGGDNSGSAVGRRLASDGSPIGTDFQINTYTTDRQRAPKPTTTGDHFVVVWVSEGSTGTDNQDWSVQGRLVSTSGTPIGAEFQVNVYTTAQQYIAHVAPAGEGFVVTWTSYGAFGPQYFERSVHARQFASDGSPLGGEFQVNSYTSGRSLDSHVSANSRGQLVVSWSSNRSYLDSTYTVQAQRFRGPCSGEGCEIFQDGYESGDTSAWD